ncbi:MAG: HIT domain-containing protein [Alysiella sp.]|uniref:HIT family protein n=1 Tax=Alysiella sp. TaxID=1872483 RepID=UPI0026DDCC0E|nr:HIT domain-containing protein [Alysiella sp.]MDO4433646.1 HIT domain-containing protein [Alysiella sp.]
MTCPLCHTGHEDILLQTEQYRVIAVHNEPNVPAFCRVIWHEHIAEMTDLSANDRQTLMNAVYQVEAAMRAVLPVHKINLASLGNMVPHLHWHVIARFADDAHFPAPIWANSQRTNTIRLPENWLDDVKQRLNAPQS